MGKPTTKSTAVTNFQAKVLARIEGATPQETVAKVERLAIATIQGQIAALKGSVVEKEVILEDAKEAEQNALFPVKLESIQNKGGFVQGIFDAKKAVAKAEKDLESTKEAIITLEEVLEQYK